MADGKPKDYSTLYCEPTSTNMGNIANQQVHQQMKPPVPSTRSRTYKPLDGSLMPQKHREQHLDLIQVVAKLENLPRKGHKDQDALHTLNGHYNEVFGSRRKADPPKPKPGFRAYIHYHDEKDTYVVRVDKNTLRAVKDKIPKRGNYRYFFKNFENTCEEIEYEDATVPFYDKDGQKQIYCQVFPY